MTTERQQRETPRSPRRLRVGFCLLMVVPLLLPACTRRVANENNKLRAERLELNDQIDELQQKLALREQELAAFRRQQDHGNPIDGAQPPRLAGLVLGRYTGPIDLDGDGRFDQLRVYLRPIDQNSRQIAAEGAARLRLVVIPDAGEPRTLVDVRYDAEQFKGAYRDGLTGTHYTLTADLPAEPPKHATLHVALTDAVTGRTYAVEQQLTLVREAQASD